MKALSVLARNSCQTRLNDDRRSEMTSITDDAHIAALTALAEAGIEPDVQELLVAGNPSRGIAPGALTKALKAAAGSRISRDDLAVALFREDALLTNSRERAPLELGDVDWNEWFASRADMPLTGPGFVALWRKLADTALKAVMSSRKPDATAPSGKEAATPDLIARIRKIPGVLCSDYELNLIVNAALTERAGHASSDVYAVPHEPTTEMLAAAMKADQDGGSASMKTIWMVMWGAYVADAKGNL
jgi:hypothetical protein